MRFRCDRRLERGRLCRRLPASVQQQLIEPLCVAALNTPAAQASAAVFLRVLRDALFSGPGSSDLLLPCAPLGELLPQPARAWFERHGVRLHRTARVTAAAARGRRLARGWRALRRGGAGLHRCRSRQAVRNHAPDWSRMAAALRYEPIVTVYLRCAGARLALPMLALHADDDAPAQFAFDLGALGGPAGVFAFVISGAREWVDRGLDATAAATLAQAGPPSHRHLASGAHAAARGRRKARDLPLHARAGAPAVGHRPAAAGGGRLRRGPVPGHAGRRGARRARCGLEPALISDARRAPPAARRRTATAAASARSSSRLRSRCCPAGSAAAATADAETSAGGCRAR